MGTTPGPIIVFRFDAAQVSPAIDQAMNEVRAKSKVTTEAVADDWKRAAAQIRASVTLGVLPEKDILNIRQQQVVNLGREIDLLRTRADLSNKQLASLKAMTLEYERQKSHIAGTGGITTGTSNALNQVSTQTMLGIERMVDSLVNRYLGGTAGAFTRTLRDISYYQNQAGTGAGGNSGFFGGLSSAVSGITDAVGPATIAVTGFVAALAGIGTAAAGITLSLARQNQEFENMAAVTGLSSRQIQVFSQLAKESQLDVNGIVTSIARFQGELGEYVRKGASANDETIRFVAGTKALGIAVEDANGKLRDPIAILSDLSNALQIIPDPAERSARALDILGSVGKCIMYTSFLV